VGWIERSQFLLAVAALAVAQVVPAQPQGKIPRVGFITYRAPSNAQERAVREAFFQGLRDNGFEDGRNVSVEVRYVEGHREREARFAAEFVASKVDVIVVAAGSSAARAAKDATSAIPIVFVGITYPDRQGLVANLARPEGNVTGIARSFDIEGDRLMQLFKQIAPDRSRVAILWDPGNDGSAVGYRDQVAAARTLGLTPISVEVKSPEAVEGALELVLRERADVLCAQPVTRLYAKRIGEFAQQHGIPIFELGSNYIKRGGVLGMYADVRNMLYRTGVYAALILKGKSPGELPVEQPAKNVLWVNLGTAKALGLTVPQSILLQADQVIE
jgi:ABC-type uncharacterized transport system substrate-binding protein